MSTAVRCQLCPTRDGVKPIAMVHVWLYPPFRIGETSPTVEYDLCTKCYREAREAGDIVFGAKLEIL